MSALFAALRLYTNSRIIAIAFLGLVSGLPLGLTGSTLSAWLNEAEISKTSIGLFALIGLPYSLKFLWAPLIDQLRLPLLTGWLGRRRSWMLCIQIGLMACLCGLGFSDPAQNLVGTALLALLVAIMSASQDIVIDAYRVEMLEDNQQGAGAASIVFGYNIGYRLIGGGLALILSDYLGWWAVYSIMAGCVILGMVTMLLAGEPDPPEAITHKDWHGWFRHAVLNPFRDFMGRSDWLIILFFIMLYKFGDAFAGVMTVPFLQDIGFSNAEIGWYLKNYGLIATIVGTILGGILVHRIGHIHSLWIGGLLQMGSNLMFVLQAQAGYHIPLLTVTITVENLSAGLGTAAFVAYISHLCNTQYTATQYALFSALAAIGRTTLSSSSGAMVEWLGWTVFFGLSVFVALPGLVLLRKLQRDV